MDNKIKALFFDIDGTLVSFETHRIPTSTVEALEEAKRKGVKVYISTGRPVPLIVNLSQVEHLIDGYVSTSGAYCFIGDEVVSCVAMLREDVEAILAACEEWKVPAVMVGTDKVAVFQEDGTIDRAFRVGLGIEGVVFSSLETLLEGPVLQITPFFTPEQEAKVRPRLKACNSARWTDAFTDITSVEADKGIGLRTMAAHEGLDIHETMAFGDGGNDIPILREAGVGVAMGNAKDDVKAEADYVTTAVDDDGVRNALRHYHVID